jgi:tetratricopeptide (TPR) repeat protein
MPRWTAFPYDNSAYRYNVAALKQHWARLHKGDAEPLPQNAQVLEAWALFHAGEFERAVAAGLEAGGDGVTAANKAQAIYANYLEQRARAKLALLLEVAERAEAQTATQPDNPNAHYWMAYALARHSQAVNVNQALAQGIGSRIKQALEAAISLQGAHADARVALGSFHADVIDKLGNLLGSTQGANKEAGLKMLREALELNPGSAITKVECANGLLMLEGERRLIDAEKLYAAAASCEPIDATERLEVEVARAALTD